MKDEQSLGELFSELARETSNLVRQEVTLAKTEMTEKATKVGKDIGSMVVGGSIAFVGVQAIVAAIIIALGHVMPLWAAALLVGVIIITISAGLVFKGINALKGENLAPRQTIETLKEDAQWAKNQMG